MDVPLSLQNPRVGDGSDPKSHGRFRLNSGSEMTMMVPGVEEDTPIRVVVDLESASFSEGRIIALHDHNADHVIGYWEKGAISALGVEADLHLIDTSTSEQRELFPEAARVAGMLKANVPIEVSIGADPSGGGDWERIEAGASVRANNQDYSGDGELPLYMLRNARIYEASIVTFGADSKTGRVAATHKPPVVEKHQMSDKARLKGLLAKHAKHASLVAGLFAEEKTDVDIDMAVRAAEMDEKDKEIAALKAKLQASLDDNKKMASDLSCKDEEEDDEKDAKAEKLYAAKLKELAELHAHTAKEIETLKAARGNSKSMITTRDGQEGEKPKSLLEAMEIEHRKDPALKGEKLRNHCLAKYGNALERLTMKARA